MSSWSVVDALCSPASMPNVEVQLAALSDYEVLLDRKTEMAALRHCPPAEKDDTLWDPNASDGCNTEP